MRCLGLAFLLCFGLLCEAQKYDNVWLWGRYPSYQDSSQFFSGNGQGDFSSDSLQVYPKYRNMPFMAAAGYFSDENGNLLIYTNGMQIKDTTGSIIQNGDSINYGVWWSQSYYNMTQGATGYYTPRDIIIFHQPENDSVILLIHEHTGDGPNTLASRVKMTKVIITPHNGFKVTTKNRIVSNYPPAFANLAACKHGNGRDWWVLFTQTNTNCVVKLLVNKDTIIEFDRQCIGDTIEGDWSLKSTFSLDGTKFGSSDAVKHGTNIFDFDRCTGVLSNYQHLNPLIKLDTFGNYNDYVITFDFSPNNKFLYVFMGQMILQYDLESPQFPNDFDTIAGWDTFVDSAIGQIYPFTYFSCTYGPDGKMYIGNAGGQRYLCTINNPNGKGDLCDFRMRSIFLPKIWTYTTPNFPNYRLGRLAGSACDTVYSDVKPIYTQTPWLKVFPNPATNDVQFDYNWIEWEKIADCELQISDLEGRVVLKQQVPKYSTRQNFSVKELAAGVYTVALTATPKSPKGDFNSPQPIAVCKLTKVQ